jgi:selenocysteine lyase/cysteine desulfurase
LIGLFSGASRLTGILADDVATTILLHQYGAVSLWDYNAVAMSAPINTNPLLPGSAKDALFFHAKHLVGGVQAPGVLVIKKALVELCSSFVSDNIETINAVRAGLAIQLKESLGAQIITARQEKMCK